jgi:hypothetical protein
MINLLDFIPLNERAAIAAYKSTYDCAPALQAAHDGLSPKGNWRGGKIYVPAGGYDLGSTINITKRIILTGDGEGDQPDTAATIFWTVPGITAFRIWSNQTSPFGGAADRTTIERMQLHPLGTSVSGHGIECDAGFFCGRDLVVRSFGGKGIFIHGNAGHNLGNANGWELTRVKVDQCGDDGICIDGADANTGSARGAKVTVCGGFGINDNSKFGCGWTDCAVGGNVAGSYRTGSSASSAVFNNCYVEGDRHATPEVNGYPLAIGGVLSAYPQFASIQGGNNLTLNAPGPLGRLIYQQNGVEVGRVDHDKVLKGFGGQK